MTATYNNGVLLNDIAMAMARAIERHVKQMSEKYEHVVMTEPRVTMEWCPDVGTHVARAQYHLGKS